jgi:hypothetical protein
MSITEKELCHLKRGSYICLLSESNDPNLLDDLLNGFIWFPMFWALQTHAFGSHGSQ